MKKLLSLLLATVLALSCLGSVAFAADNTLVNGCYYDGTYHTPEPEVTLSTGEKLVKNRDYTVSYQDNKDAGTAKVIIKGLGPYSSYTETLTFTIYPRPISVKVDDQTYTQKDPQYNYSYTVTQGSIVNGDNLKPSYSISHTTTSTNTAGITEIVDTVTATFANGNYNVAASDGVVRTVYSENGAKPTSELTIAPISPVTYNGQYQTPVVTVKNGLNQTLVSGTDYSTNYSNNKNAGTATVTVSGKGTYSGMSATQTFKINKRDVTVTVSDVTVKQNEGYSGSWSASQDICYGDALPTPSFNLPDSSSQPGKYPITIMFPESQNYNIIVKNGTLTILANGNSNGNTGGNTGGNTSENSGGNNSSNPQTPASYSITATCNEGGSIFPSGTFTVKSGETVAFKISTNTGYHIKAVYVDGKPIDIREGYTFTNLGSDKKVYVEFEKTTATGTDTGTSDISSSIDLEDDPAISTPDNNKLPFLDVKPGDWFYESVRYAFAKDILHGTGAQTFSPYVNTTRAMIVTILHRFENSPVVITDTNAFTDVKAGDWYEAAVKWAAANGIVNGYGNGKFGPNDLVTREQLVTILYNYARYKNYETNAASTLSSFTDSKDISKYAQTPMQWAYTYKLMSGKTSTTLAPKDYATRAEVAAIVQRFDQNIVITRFPNNIL